MIKIEKIWKQIFLVVLSVSLFLVLVVVGVGTYKKNLTEKDYQEVFRQNTHIESVLKDITLKLYSENEMYKTGNVDYVEIFVNENSLITTEIKDKLEVYLRRNYIDYLTDVYNIDAVFIDNITSKQIYYNKGSILAHNLKDVNKDEMRFWYRVDYDSKGNQKITSLDSKLVYDNNPLTRVAMDLKYAMNSSESELYGVAKSSDIQETMLTESLRESMISVPEIKDCTIIFGIPDTMVGFDSITSIIDTYSGGMPYYQIESLFLLTMFILLGYAFFVPFNKIRESQYGVYLDKSWWEVRAILVFLFIMISLSPISELSEIAYNISSYRGESNFFDIVANSLLAMFLITVGSLGIVISVYWLKTLFKDSWKTTVAKIKIKSVIERCLSICKKWMISLVTIQLSSDAYIKLAGILVINIIIISMIVLIFGYWFGAILYSIILAFCAIYFMKEIQKNYQKLLECTQRLSNGDLSTEIDENLGAFEPLKNELENIRIGFKVAIDEETKSQKMKTELISNVSHDLKTPLTSMISYIDLLKKEKDIKKKKEYLETVERNSLRLKHLIDDLFEVSKANSGDIRLEVMDVDLVSLVNQTLFECKPQIDKAKIKFKTNFSSDKIIVKLDAHKTFRIIENLITNAAKYSVESTRVYIEIEESEYDVQFSIKNISAEEITFDPNDLVERFVRGDKSRNSEGSGLGLAIAKGFTEAQNGKFNIDTDGDYFKVLIKFTKS
ncbi:sensor histidine kinase [Anaerorhabdus sp.]|uniref:sensor histidine kinase n=1 Tax=Anaerorhabdus sp. TaxID=1872524 RepID=UPI002FC61C83